MSSREKILDAVRAISLDDRPLPDMNRDWIVYDDPTAQFLEVLPTVGGSGVICSASEMQSKLNEQETFRQAKTICSLVDGVEGNLSLDSVDDPHDLEWVDFAILPAHFAVAENGAVWFTDRGIRHRVLPFITQHLALVVPASDVIHNMHQAYDRLSMGEQGFGVFISGPSKTADIEQSLVIGAHGARSLTVFLVS